MYTLKSIARRGTLLGAAFALLASSLLPALPVYADALNPLTDRSLTLSSSAPGWDYLDGSGNSTYAPPNSGANGQKVANYFDFRVSTDTTVSGGILKAMSFQYCTTPAGDCLAPGDNGWSGPATRNPNSTTTSDFNITVDGDQSQATIADDDPTDYVTMTDTTVSSNGNGDFTSIPCSNDETPAVPGFQAGDCNDVTGRNFAVYYDNGGTWTESPDWDMTAANFEINGGSKTSGVVQNQATGAYNEIRLEYDADEDGSGTTGFTSGTRVRVVFFATEDNYITNPGSGAFFVRINTYNTDGNDDINDMARFAEDHTIDGGVTVANVMNLGIQIVTKVLETMAFSVGVVDPYTLSAGTAGAGTLSIAGTAVTGAGTDFDGELAPGDTIFITSGAEAGTTHTIATVTDDTTATVSDSTTVSSGSFLISNATTSQLVAANGNAKHGVCDPVLTRMTAAGSEPRNRLLLGDPSAEYSLAVDKTYSTHSYFRLSSNSSAGATVYYSGNTLTNTVNDEIAAIGATKASPQPGGEQFGIALAVNSAAPHNIDYRTETKAGYMYETGVDLTPGNAAAGLATYSTGPGVSGQGIHSHVTDNGVSNIDANLSWHTPQLAPKTDTLQPEDNYNNGAGWINTIYNNNALTDSLFGGDPTQFAFDKDSTLIPVPIATGNANVVDCVTGKVRYIANIAATTPAGIYTTKINYIAAPQY